jgi:hypothetical protein
MERVRGIGDAFSLWQTEDEGCRLDEVSRTRSLNFAAPALWVSAS